ncbi:Uncharacterized protein Fot_37723 [Forsythia ovata]|uniref:Uncharacterized protein n=1 Tax=Forsythia ovata TaxID=205694 RepID=A0ABD1S0K0_9LAMI
MKEKKKGAGRIFELAEKINLKAWVLQLFHFQEKNQEIEEIPDEQVIEQELAIAIDKLSIHHPKSINALLNPKEEQQIAHEEISDEYLIAIVSSEHHHKEEVEEYG